MPLKQKDSGVADSGRKKKRDGSGKKQKLEFDYKLEKEEKKVVASVLVKATVHGDVCDFDDAIGLGEGAHLASGKVLESCLTHVFNFLKDEGQLRHVPLKMKRQGRAITITLPTKTSDYQKMLKYQIGVLLPVALLREGSVGGLYTPSPKRTPRGNVNSVDKESFEQLRREIEELTKLRTKEVSQLEEKNSSLMQAAKRRKTDDNRKDLEDERDQLLTDLRELRKENRSSQKELHELRKEKTYRIEAGLKEMEALKHQKVDLEQEIHEKKRIQTQQFVDINSKFAQQLAVFSDMMQKQQDQMSQQQNAGSPSPGGTLPVSYVLDNGKYPMGCRLRAEPDEQSKYHTNKTTGDPVIIPPTAMLFFCNSRHNGFSKVRTATGPVGYVRSKYLLPVHPMTPTEGGGNGGMASSPGSMPTPSQPIFTEAETSQFSNQSGN